MGRDVSNKRQAGDIIFNLKQALTRTHDRCRRISSPRFPTYIMKSRFSFFQRHVAFRKYFKKAHRFAQRALRVPMLQKEAGERGWRVGPARFRSRPGLAAPPRDRTGFFFVAQWLKRQQCVAMLLCRQQQKCTMYLQMIINQRASY